MKLTERQKKYQKIVQALDRILYLIGKYEISYQETQKAAANGDALWNPGNFLTVVQQVNHLLYEYICSTLRNEFFFMSPTIQNELIGIVAKCTIQIWLKK